MRLAELPPPGKIESTLLEHLTARRFKEAYEYVGEVMQLKTGREFTDSKEFLTGTYKVEDDRICEAQVRRQSGAWEFRLPRISTVEWKPNPPLTVQAVEARLTPRTPGKPLQTPAKIDIQLSPEGLIATFAVQYSQGKPYTEIADGRTANVTTTEAAAHFISRMDFSPHQVVPGYTAPAGPTRDVYVTYERQDGSTFTRSDDRPTLASPRDIDPRPQARTPETAIELLQELKDLQVRVSGQRSWGSTDPALRNLLNQKRAEFDAIIAALVSDFRTTHPNEKGKKFGDLVPYLQVADAKARSNPYKHEGRRRR